MGIIYLLCELGSNPEKYKIGITKGDPNKRVKQLQTGCSNEIIVLKTFKSQYYTKIESSLHREYKLYASSGGKEWFTLPSEFVFSFDERCTQLHENFTMLEESGNPFFK
jgi:hypothetical protein